MVASSPGSPAVTAAPVLFHVRQLTKTYAMGEVEVQAQHHVDLDIYAGEFVVLLGPSGSGKSTLLNILGGLDRPSGGEVYFGPQNLTQASDRQLTGFRRQFIGFIFQFYNLIPSLTAAENVALVTDLAAHPMPPRLALELVGLGDRHQHFPSQLSGGEQQRVAIARAIAKRPQVLLCDEPTGALDYSTGKRVLEVLARVNQDLGTTVVIITHNAGIGAMGDRVITMRDGQIQSIEHHAQRARPDQLEW